MKRPILTMSAILLLLALLIVTPVVVTGYQSERNARFALAAGNKLEAAQQFELAAQRLFWKPELWNEAGDAYSKAYEQDYMVLAYENARRRNVLSACGWGKLGFSKVDATDLDNSDGYLAIEIWQEGLKQYPENLVLNVFVSYAYRSFGDASLERQYLLDALAYEEDARSCDGEIIDTSSIHYRVGTLWIVDDPELALDELNTAARLDDQYAPVVETLRTSLNLASLEDDPAEKLILIGRGLGLADEWQLAASAFHDATQADAESASAWAWLAEAQYQIGEDPADAFAVAASLDPNDATFLSLHALYAQRNGELEVAQIDFEKLAELEPENPNWQTSLGALYAEQGDLPTALAAYEKAIELEPTNPLYRQLMALFSFNYGYDLDGIGVSAARRAVILAPEEAQYIDTLGLVYLGLDQDEDAERQFLRVLEVDAEYAAAHLHLGMLYLKRGHPELAYASLVQARDLDVGGVVSSQAIRLLDEYFQ